MNERIELTDKDITMRFFSENMAQVIISNKHGTNEFLTKEEAEQLKQQMIEDHQKSYLHDSLQRECQTMLDTISQLSIANRMFGDENNQLREQCSKLDKENKELKEKLKFYLEPFELRPTYQELEKKLEKIQKVFDNIHFTDDGERFNDKIREILESKND